MRQILLALALLLAASPAVAQSQGDVFFGKTTCRPSFQCPASYDTMTLRGLLPKLLSTANSCVASRFGMRRSDGHFETSMGLDSSYCFYSKPVSKAEKGLTFVPKCCIERVSGSRTKCQIICTRYGKH